MFNSKSDGIISTFHNFLLAKCITEIEIINDRIPTLLPDTWSV